MASLTIPTAVRPTRPAAARPAAAGTRLRLTRRGRRLARVVAVLVFLLLAFVGLVAGQGAVSRAGDAPTGPATRLVVVQPGQTLWGIAAATLPGEDTREAVRRIADLNDIDPGATLVPGRPLALPVTG